MEAGMALTSSFLISLNSWLLFSTGSNDGSTGCWLALKMRRTWNQLRSHSLAQQTSGLKKATHEFDEALEKKVKLEVELEETAAEVDLLRVDIVVKLLAKVRQLLVHLHRVQALKLNNFVTSWSFINVMFLWIWTKKQSLVSFDQTILCGSQNESKLRHLELN